MFKRRSAALLLLPLIFLSSLLTVPASADDSSLTITVDQNADVTAEAIIDTSDQHIDDLEGACKEIETKIQNGTTCTPDGKKVIIKITKAEMLGQLFGFEVKATKIGKEVQLKISDGAQFDAESGDINIDMPGKITKVSPDTGEITGGTRLLLPVKEIQKGDTITITSNDKQVPKWLRWVIIVVLGVIIGAVSTALQRRKARKAAAKANPDAAGPWPGAGAAGAAFPGPGGQPYPGQPMPGQPYPGQPYPTQPMPGQPYPQQPNPAQPGQGQGGLDNPGSEGAGNPSPWAPPVPPAPNPPTNQEQPGLGTENPASAPTPAQN